MKIFVPGKPDVNPYLKEIIYYSKHEWIYGNLEDINSENGVVINIHWPEAIFSWEIPTMVQLDWLENKIKTFKESTKIVYTRHDDKNNFEENENFRKLRLLIERYADVIVHLGSYSKVEYQEKYPNKKHVIIPHPLYKNSFEILSKNKAREILKIPQNNLVIIAAGRIRHKIEKDLVLKIFKLFPGKNKTLIANRMAPYRTTWPYRGKTRWNKFVNRFYSKWIYKAPGYIFNYTFASFEQLSVMMSAADIVLVPRINVLNSGNVFLGLSYKKFIMGPETGNVTEQLKMMDFPTFDPFSSDSIKEAINVFLDSNGDFYSKKTATEFMKSLQPEKISKSFDLLFEDLISKN